MQKGDLIYARKKAVFKDLNPSRYYLISDIYLEETTNRWVYDFHLSNKKKRKRKMVGSNYADVLDYWIGTTRFNLLKVINSNRQIVNFKR